ncbi:MULTISPECIES: serine hydrolase [Streptomyces]|uniref:serine hydrolase n=1 Tax=Streptomyces TaxID=1883 RepID=UPI00099DCDE4
MTSRHRDHPDFPSGTMCCIDEPLCGWHYRFPSRAGEGRGAKLRAVEGSLKRVADVISKDAQLGIQLYVSLDGEVLADEAFGHVRPGIPLHQRDALPWICCTKMMGSLAMAQQLQEHGLTPHHPVADIVPEYAVGGKREATLAQLMSHALPFEPESANRPYSGLDDEEALAQSCAVEMAAPPGTGGWYSAMGSWVVVAEVVRRLSGRTYAEYVADHVLKPLGMRHTVFGPAPVPRSPALFERVEEGHVPSENVFPGVLTPRLPGTGAWGPASDLARLVEWLTAPQAGEALGLSPGTVRALTDTYRTGLPDRNFGDIDLDWGFGVCTDPAWFGVPRGSKVVGHTAYGCGMVVADLEERLVVSFLSSSVVPPDSGESRLENRIVRELCREVRGRVAAGR